MIPEDPQGAPVIGARVKHARRALLEPLTDEQASAFRLVSADEITAALRRSGPPPSPQAFPTRSYL